MKFSTVLLALTTSLYSVSAANGCRQCSCSYSIGSDHAVPLNNLTAQGLIKKAVSTCAGGADQTFNSGNTQNSAQTNSIGSLTIWRLCNNGASWTLNTEDRSSANTFKIRVVCDCRKSVPCLSGQNCSSNSCRVG